MKNDITFVTCIYDDMHDTEFAGRHNRGSHYVFSLAQIHQMGAPVYCFTDKVNMLKFFPVFLNYGYENFHFLNYNLAEFPYHQEILRVKRAKPELYQENISWRTRCVEIMWAKFEWMMHVMEKNGTADAEDKYTFWIDGGLSHEGIFPKKYNTVRGKRNYSSNADEYHDRFFINRVFNPNLPDYLVEYMDGADLLHFVCRSPQHNDPHPYPRTPKKVIGTPAGGLFGGRNRAIYDWCKQCKSECEFLLSKDFLLKEEDILNFVINKNFDKDPNFGDKIKMYTFHTWYHEDWDVYRPNEISFSDFFTEV